MLYMMMKVSTGSQNREILKLYRLEYPNARSSLCACAWVCL